MTNKQAPKVSPYPGRDIEKLQQEGTTLLALLALGPVCPTCGRYCTVPVQDGMCIYYVPSCNGIETEEAK